MMKQFDHMIERKLNLELSNVFPRLSNVFLRLKFLAGCGQFSDFSNILLCLLPDNFTESVAN
jgi:hypothetical protein